MKRSTRSNGALAFTAFLALGLTACSKDHSGDSATPDVAPSIAIPAALSALTGASTTLPADWPAGIPVPAGLDLLHVIQSPTSTTGKIAIYYGVGDKAAVVSQMTTGLEAAGFTQVSAMNHGESISISTWKKGDTNLALNINTAAGKVTCSISVNTGA